jgi:hypothetical protein
MRNNQETDNGSKDDGWQESINGKFGPHMAHAVLKTGQQYLAWQVRDIGETHLLREHGDGIVAEPQAMAKRLSCWLQREGISHRQ